MTAASVCAGVIFVPVGNVYTDLETATVSVVSATAAAAWNFTVRSSDLGGLMTIDCSGSESDCLAKGIPLIATAFSERSELRVNRVEGTVTGTVGGRLDDVFYRYRGEIRGAATCASPQGNRCRRMVFTYRTRAVLFDPADASRVGRLAGESIGSLLVEVDGARWADLGSSGQLGLVSAR
jgi:hypothetical protein